MKYIESQSRDPYFNLALEEYVFNSLPKTDSYFMLWQNDNTIVIGKYQNTAEEINQTYVDEHGIKVVRRLSGGGAVYHDKGNLNFTFIVDQREANDFNFSIFVVPIVETLKKFGVDAQFNGRNDITIDGKKFSGNSQYVKKGRVLHHGCIMLDSNIMNVADALRVKDAKFVSKNVKSVRSRVTTINSNAKDKIEMDDFKRALREEIFGTGEVTPYELTKEDLAQIEKLRDEKYKTWDWNYGKAVKHTMVREEKFEAGLVTVHLTSENGVIKDIKIYGDFFGKGDIEDFEGKITGLKLDENLPKKLEEAGLEYYMHGIKAAELSGLIRG